MSNLNLNDFVKEISSQILSNNSEYTVQRISEILSSVMDDDLMIDTDISKVIGYASAAAVTVSVELSSAVIATVLAQLGILEHDGHPHLRPLPVPDHQS